MKHDRLSVAIRRLLLPAALATLLAVQAVSAAEPEPAPRNADGRVLISNAPGQPMGLWVPDYGTGIPFFNVEDIAFKPWAKGLFDARQAHDLEPHARCKASGAIRQLLTPYGVEILEIAALQKVLVFDIGGPHSYREIFLDGRPHPADPEPTNYGHSIGWWEGDTLVVDSIGYNTDFWFERMGLPHTESVHITEYFSRDGKNRLRYRFVMEDPMTYDAPVEGKLTLNWREGLEMFEFMCQQSNYAYDLMVNENNEAIGKESLIVP
jgi:hypothetical protein